MTEIKKVSVSLPNTRDQGKLAFILLNVLTPEECSEWIKLTEERGYQPALVNVGMQEVLMTDFRNSDRCIIDDPDMANIVFERIKSYLPQTWENHQIVGLNERLRFLRYDPGQKFEQHMGKKKPLFLHFPFKLIISLIDGVYVRRDGSGERSFIVSYYNFVYF